METGHETPRRRLFPVPVRFVDPVRTGQCYPVRTGQCYAARTGQCYAAHSYRMVLRGTTNRLVARLPTRSPRLGGRTSERS
jgi:hypothetical protein